MGWGIGPYAHRLASQSPLPYAQPVLLRVVRRGPTAPHCAQTPTTLSTSVGRCVPPPSSRSGGFSDQLPRRCTQRLRRDGRAGGALVLGSSLGVTFGCCFCRYTHSPVAVAVAMTMMVVGDAWSHSSQSVSRARNQIGLGARHVCEVWLRQDILLVVSRTSKGSEALTLWPGATASRSCKVLVAITILTQQMELRYQ